MCPKINLSSEWCVSFKGMSSQKLFFVFPSPHFFSVAYTRTTTNTILVVLPHSHTHTQGTTDIFNVYLLLFPKLSSCEKRRNIMDEISPLCGMTSFQKCTHTPHYARILKTNVSIQSLWCTTYHLCSGV